MPHDLAAVMYVGATRPRAHLVVVASENFGDAGPPAGTIGPEGVITVGIEVVVGGVDGAFAQTLSHVVLLHLPWVE